MIRIQHKSWDANGRAHSYRLGSLVFIARWPRLWFVLDYSPKDLNKQMVIINVGPFRGPGEMYLKFWGGQAANYDRYAWWHFPRRRA